MAEVVTSKNIWARRYINMILGKVHRCNRYQDLKKYPVSITMQCMRYQNHVVSAIRPEIYETPYIGADAYKKQLEQCKNRKVELEQILSVLNEKRDNLRFVMEPLSTTKDIDVKYRLKSLENLRVHERALAANFERAKKANWTLKEKAEGEMGNAMRAYKVAHNFGAAETMAGFLEYLAEYNIYRNPSWLMMKGNVKFQKISGNRVTEIELQSFGGGLGVSNQDIESICWNPKSRIEKIVTVENLTSFHQWRLWEDTPALCIYLGGYHNQVKRLFLQNLYKEYPNAEYYHFGDIDCGGFRIWKDLCVKTGIPFKTLCMDLVTYDKYLVWGRKLTEQDRKTMDVMLKDPFFKEQTELFMSMLKKGVKLEQECVEEGW